ncbi:MAG: T9SS type A sorting domain-containing protein [Bacteroidales bacterium]|nr:T9SS type A sorting domain-containing protein [Bacteroidales bacterium]MCF8350370.1 T9SS type A sorting domain-containing protein [Bacteroidales bacterium]MCF8376257.1 T9SS type A sorting domain-containing protein [Bacteroidales bacterium]MCF8401932.1 T9SS type A sorting domain-containing protein [Bacteroidales bacterium]
MKRIILPLILLMTALNGFSDNWIGIDSDKAEPAEIKLISSDIETSVIEFDVKGFYEIPVNTPKGEAFVIGIPKATPILEKGAPDLPKLTASVIIPDLAEMQVEVIAFSYKDYKNIEIAPSKGNLTRDIDPATVPYTYGPAYETDAMHPAQLAGLRDPHIVRDFRGQTIVVYPFQYNPVSKTLRVYDNIRVKISKQSNAGINQLVRKEMTPRVNPAFQDLYQRHFLNLENTRYTPVSEYGNMLIIAYGDFMDEMEDYVDWKIQKGYPTQMVDIATIGNNSYEIENYIENYYNNNGLTFVLLVGDAEQVTPSFSNGDSDNNYTYVAGSDHYPDLFIGRFSGETGDHIATQVERTLDYEKNPYVDEDWFTHGIGISSDQGPGDDGEYDYEHIRNIHDDLLAFTYTYCHELFDGSQGGLDEPGNPTPDMVAQAVNDGATIINYTGHGSSTSWGSSGFSSSHVNQLTNNDMLPFIFSVACVNGNFVGGDCFAEAWMRATNDDEPSGAIATLMSTINQSWNPPMAGQDEMNDILVESYSDNIKRTFAAIGMHACMLMNDEYGSGGDEMTDTWTVFGDPSVFVRTAVPEDITANYPDVAFIGTSSFTVNCQVEDALVCLTLDGEILATAFVENGAATLNFDELEDFGTITITITAFNYVPHIGEIDIIQPDGHYCVYEDHDVNDYKGNNNGVVDYNESIYLHLTLENMGTDPGENIETTISTYNSYITMNDDFEVFDYIPAGGTATVEDGYQFKVADDIPDMSNVKFGVSATDGEDTWESEFSITVKAPVLNIDEFSILDTANGGNGNGILDPGETVDVKIKNFNTGHCPAYNTTGIMTLSSPYIYIGNDQDSIGNIYLLSPRSAYFTITADSATPPGEVLNLDYEVCCGGYTISQSFTFEVGTIYEDWESSDMSKFDWQTGGDKDWMVSANNCWEGSYSAASGNIGNNESTYLSLEIKANAYDTISFYLKTSTEPGRDFLKFYINGNQKAQWAGEHDWQKISIPIPAGNHTIKWEYSKDDLLSFGDDRVWIDYIVFPPMPVLNAFAGRDNTVCQGSDFQCEGIAQNYSSLQWTTSGDGTFDDNTIINPVYIMGDEDWQEGEATLSLTAYGDEGEMDTDDMLLTSITEPAVPEMPSGLNYVDVGYVETSDYETEEVQWADSYQWMIEPADAGIITGDGPVGTVEWNSSYLGLANIYVKALNDCGESQYSEGIEVTVDNTVDIQEVENKQIVLYPNPASEQITFEIAGAVNATFSIHDITGAMVKRGSLKENQDGYTIDLSGMQPGVYFMTAVSAENTYFGKFIVNEF